MAKPAPKMQATGSSRQRSIDFNIIIDDESTESASPAALSLHVCIYFFILLCLIYSNYNIFPCGTFSANNQLCYS